jgi:hypothetical protein
MSGSVDRSPRAQWPPRARQESGRGPAKANNAQHLVAAALGRDPGPSLEDAQSAHADAEASLAEARATLDVLDASKEDAEKELDWAKRMLADAIRGVIRSERATRDLLARFAAARRELMGLRQALELLSGKNALPDDARLWRCDPDDRDRSPATVARTSAITALERDADAALPE